MTLEEQRRMESRNIDYKVFVESTTRTEVVTRVTALPDPSLRLARKVRVNQTPDGPEIEIIELFEYVDNDRKTFDRNAERYLQEIPQTFLSEEAVVRMAFAVLETGSKVRMLSDLR